MALKAFNRWGTEGIVVEDAGLKGYITLEPKIAPKTGARYVGNKFHKSKTFIVERLINKVMRSGQGKRKLSGKYIRGRGSCGKKLQAMGIVERAFERVEKETKQNPIQVFIKAIEKSAPREDVTRIKKGGIKYSQAVDVSPMKRVDESLKNIALAAFSGSFNNKKKAEDALAEEIIAASKEDSKSFSVKRRDEVERIAKSSR